jgi:hypothetical protein
MLTRRLMRLWPRPPHPINIYCLDPCAEFFLVERREKKIGDLGTSATVLLTLCCHAGSDRRRSVNYSLPNSAFVPASYFQLDAFFPLLCFSSS